MDTDNILLKDGRDWTPAERRYIASIVTTDPKAREQLKKRRKELREHNE